MPVTVLFLAACGQTHSGKKPPAAVQGVIDLREWDFEKDGPAALGGEWEFVQGRLLTPSEFAGLERADAGVGFIRAPAVWNDQETAGSRLQARGAGTYRLRVLLADHTPRLAMRMDYQGSAAHFYWNEERIAESGKPGTSEEAESARWLVNYSNLPRGSGTLVVPVSNHIHRQGGLWLPLEIGAADQIYKRRDLTRGGEMFLAGSLIIMGLYHLGLFAYRRKDTSALWFGLLCIAVVLRLLSTGERILPNVSGWPLFITLKLEYLAYYLAAPAAFLFLRTVFSVGSRKASRAAVGISALFILAVVFLPAAYYTQTLIAHHVWAMFLSMNMLVVTVRSALARQSGASLIALGWTVFIATLVNDILYNEFLIGSGFLVPVGIFVLMFTQAAALSGRIATAFNKSEELAEHLQAAYEESLHLRKELLARDKLAAIGDMAAGIVHDLKNPVGLIKGSVELADDDSLGRDERREMLQIIDQEADRMLLLVQDLLDFSRGSVSIQKSSVSTADYLKRVESAILPAFRAKGVSISLSDRAGGTVFLDPERFLRAIVNIGGNAAEALSDGGTFELSVARQNGSVLFTLRDNGPGIPEEIRESLFEPFVTHGKSHGTGLGMAIAKSMVEAHGGTISFETQRGKGTTFTIEVPA